MSEHYWLTPEDLADELGVPLATVYAWRYKGTAPPGYRFGKHIRFKRTDVETWMASRADLGSSGGPK